MNNISSILPFLLSKSGINIPQGFGLQNTNSDTPNNLNIPPMFDVLLRQMNNKSAPSKNRSGGEVKGARHSQNSGNGGQYYGITPIANFASKDIIFAIVRMLSC